MITCAPERGLDVIDELTRRTFIGGSFSLAALVGACGTNPAPSTGAPAAGSGFPVTLGGHDPRGAAP